MYVICAPCVVPFGPQLMVVDNLCLGAQQDIMQKIRKSKWHVDANNGKLVRSRAEDLKILVQYPP